MIDYWTFQWFQHELLESLKESRGVGDGEGDGGTKGGRNEDRGGLILH